MGLSYENLTADIRAYMTDEILQDIAADRLYLGQYLSQGGQGDWAGLLQSAVQNGNDDSLAAELRRGGRLNATAQRRKPKGGYTNYTVPATAPAMLAEGEFNRFYVRALCRYAIDRGIPRLEIYRAKAVTDPRTESEEKIGLLIDPTAVLADLRASPGVETALGLPPGPNSGLSARIPQ